MQGDVGKLLVVLGVVVALVGAVLWLGPRLPLGHLPGDFRFQRGPWTILVPIGTSIVLSLVLTLLLNLLLRRWR